MFGLGFQEVLILLVIALILFGSRRLPEVGKALGRSIHEFKKAVQGEEKEKEKEKENSENGDKQP